MTLVPSRRPAKRRRSSYRDPLTGVETHVKDHDDLLAYTTDWTNLLRGDTIATAAFEATGGITLDATANDTTTTTATVSGSQGEVKTTITTTTSGETLVRREYFEATRRSGADLGYWHR